jgi:alkylated DNA repair dioxygenase AlkB
MWQQSELFDSTGPEGLSKNHLGIPGLVYFPNLLETHEQIRILTEIDSRPWQLDLKRRVQHYGYKYNYKARKIDLSMYVGPLPQFAIDVANRLLDNDLIIKVPDQLIINEYEPGQGITAHIDCEPCFDDTIVTVSLGSVYEMDLICVATRQVKSLLLELGSALVLSKDARYKWMHRIKGRKKDHQVPRARRVSLTFRNVIIAHPEDTLPTQ